MQRLQHVDGLRFLAQMWILASENLFLGWKPLWMRRPDAAVSMFIALSGFCTHYAYAQKVVL
jgi:peptidoglycan/LPS O-acetylase OafA/YrhL